MRNHTNVNNRQRLMNLLNFTQKSPRFVHRGDLSYSPIWIRKTHLIPIDKFLVNKYLVISI